VVALKSVVTGSYYWMQYGQYILIIGHIVTSFHSDTAVQKQVESGIRDANSGCRTELGNSDTKKVCIERGSKLYLCLLLKAEENITRG